MTLHIYGPYAHHDDVKLVGTREALTKLRAMLDGVLACQSAPTITEVFFPNDGEGFGLEVRLVTAEELDHYVPPYSAAYLQDPTPNPDWPRRRV